MKLYQHVLKNLFDKKFKLTEDIFYNYDCCVSTTIHKDENLTVQVSPFSGTCHINGMLKIKMGHSMMESEFSIAKKDDLPEEKFRRYNEFFNCIYKALDAQKG
jgi:hypothetical protein